MFWSLVVIGALVSFVCYILLRHRSARRPPFREDAEAPVWLGMILAAGVWAIFIGMAYSSFANTYFAIGFEGDTMVLQYEVSGQTVRLPRAAIERVSLGLAGKTTRALRIQTTEGQVYTSGQSSGGHLREVAKTIDAWLVAPGPQR